ncbi:MAG: MarR family transcriptional regulator, partial [Planctomycetota bacterium]
MAKRTKDHVARDTYLALVRANEQLQGSASSLFKSRGLTQAQYNVLRILRGAGGDGLPCQAIGERLITRVPD